MYWDGNVEFCMFHAQYIRNVKSSVFASILKSYSRVNTDTINTTHSEMYWLSHFEYVFKVNRTFLLRHC